MLAFLLHGVHAPHFLPVAWVAAANPSAALFAALTLGYWLVVVMEGGAGVGLMVVLFQFLALLSRDDAIILSALLLILALWLQPRFKVPRPAWVRGGMCLCCHGLVAAARLLHHARLSIRLSGYN